MTKEYEVFLKITVSKISLIHSKSMEGLMRTRMENKEREKSGD